MKRHGLLLIAALAVYCCVTGVARADASTQGKTTAPSRAIAQNAGLTLALQGQRLTGLITDPRVAEISGIAASARSDEVLWAINDSGNAPELYALTPSGRVLQQVRIAGVANTDWEDLAAFTRDGKPYLLIADIGDNGGVRAELQLIVVAEPMIGEDTPSTVEPAYVLRVQWPDGPRDSEAVAVNPQGTEALLMSKRRAPAQLFAVSLAPPTDREQVRTARLLTAVSGIPQPSGNELRRAPRSGLWLAQPTAMDIRADGSVVILTYRDAYFFAARPGGDLAAALARAPQRLHLPPLPQGEAIAFARDGQSIWATSERLPAPLLRTTAPR